MWFDPRTLSPTFKPLASFSLTLAIFFSIGVCMRPSGLKPDLGRLVGRLKLRMLEGSEEGALAVSLEIALYESMRAFMNSPLPEGVVSQNLSRPFTTCSELFKNSTPPRLFISSTRYLCCPNLDVITSRITRLELAFTLLMSALVSLRPLRSNPL